MSAGMAEVIAAHNGYDTHYSEDAWDAKSWYTTCDGCYWQQQLKDAPATDHAAHVAEELAKAGYGNVADAWDEGATAGWKQSGEGLNAEYPDESTGECSVELSANPYREPQHG